MDPNILEIFLASENIKYKNKYREGILQNNKNWNKIVINTM
jgi:hypothetical protein